VSGEIIEFNSDLDSKGGDQPDLVNTDPYGNGWIVKIKMSNPAQVEGLLDAESYRALIS
jgi:glycine cleavage system H protein